MADVLVTGADGCIGAWVVRRLLDDGDAVTVFDLGSNDARHELVAASVGGSLDFERVVGDITDTDAVWEAMGGVDQVIHLAALQVPFCAADPPLGAAVNVVGTVNVFEAAAELGVGPVVYASSIAVFGSADDYAPGLVPVDAARLPRTLYGVFKVANEDSAAVYATERGLATVGLRPHTVFGPGRDQGLTSQPTVAIDHAARGEGYAVDYGGTLDFQYAPDVAAAFVAAARSEPAGARVYNLEGHVMGVADFIDRVGEVTGFDDLATGTEPLPLPAGASADGLETLGLADPTDIDLAIHQTCETFAGRQHRSP